MKLVRFLTLILLLWQYLSRSTLVCILSMASCVKVTFRSVTHQKGVRHTDNPVGTFWKASTFVFSPDFDAGINLNPFRNLFQCFFYACHFWCTDVCKDGGRMPTERRQCVIIEVNKSDFWYTSRYHRWAGGPLPETCYSRADMTAAQLPTPPQLTITTLACLIFAMGSSPKNA